MRVVIQRVSEAGVVVGGRKVSSIGPGLLVLAAFKTDDGEEELSWMARKCLELRIFEDGEGKMNRSLLEEGGESGEAERLYGIFLEILREEYDRVAEGIFGAKMRVELVNDGPVTIIIDREVGG